MILCIESSTAVCSVALTDNGKVIASREILGGFSHAEKLTVFVSEVLSEAGISVKDLSAVAVSRGPGSYTGLRIGVSVAKGLCLAVEVPLISISTLEAMASGAIEKSGLKEDANILFCPMIDARRMEVYCELFDVKLKHVSEPAAVVVDEATFSQHIGKKKIFYFGDGAEKCQTVLSKEFIYLPGILPSAKFLAGLALKKFSEKDFENLSAFEPLYLKEYMPGVKKV